MSFDTVQEDKIEYANFWTRFGAYFLDILIIAPISLGLNYINFLHFKSFWVYLLITILGLLYKPYFEYKYGATFGKMATNLKVTDYSFNQIDFQRSIIRSLIFILPSTILIPIQYMAYHNPALMDINSFWEFSTLVAQTYPAQNVFSCLSTVLVITDLIVLLADDMKKQRSLHDRIAKTYVIKSK
ncbi:RDD family protein [Allomuricauda sp. SCSIO 65647]|uniref:RDD family protein n=1 Tax=Allomuricauda sp. SCSIO 65647 TaxID=2908843 RepID=UPI001F37FAD8|nr:RDD family protein [Muricauda sp. SCSIO 65647]UJH68842.1 RDD family protein [Muricauda sp. SCSIO 65647]